MRGHESNIYVYHHVAGDYRLMLPAFSGLFSATADGIEVRISDAEMDHLVREYVRQNFTREDLNALKKELKK